jgi:hypothetical protein
MLLLGLTPALVLGQNGKIHGKVVDRETGDALPGANVVVVGTSLGAATDVNGEYYIFNVPAGIYSLKSSFIGYRDVTISNVQVSADLTTAIEFQLPSEALEVSEIQIVAERPLVNKSATNAVRIASAEVFEKLPIRGTQAIFGLQAGVVVQNNNIHIRGGRKDEVGFMVEGATARDIDNGNNAVNVIPEALEEAQIQAGGFNAEYGGANAGIISQTFRSGTPNFHARLQLETDQVPGQSLGEDNFANTFSYGYENYVLTLSGPIYKNRIKAFVALERETFDDNQRVFWSPLDVQGVVNNLLADPATRELMLELNQANLVENEDGSVQIVDSGNNGGQIGEVFPQYNVFGGNLPDERKRHTLNATLNFDFNPVLFRVSAASTFQEDELTSQFANFRPLLYELNRDRFGQQDLSTNLFTGKMTHLLSNTTFYEVQVNYFDQRRKQFDPNFGDNYLLYADSMAVADVLGADVAGNYRSINQGPAAFDIFRFPFVREGTQMINYFKQHQAYISGSADFTTQIKSHAVKVGGNYERWTARLLSTVGQQGQLQTMRQFPDLARAIHNGPSDPLYRDALLRWRRAGNVNAYGYDVFGNEVNDDSALNDGAKHPTFGAFYIQDKFEAGDLVINAGLRFDYFDFDQSIPPDLADPDFDREDLDVPLSALTQQDAKTEISPRLGFAFPVTDRTVFHVQYGRFVQAPQFINMYSGRGSLALNFTGGNFILNPRIAEEIQPITTIQYEIGFNQALTDFAAFDVTAFYRDVKGQLQVRLQSTATGADARAYQVFQNQDFATTKGLELSLNLRRTQRVAASLNYTFSDAQATGSFPNANIGATSLADPVPTVVSPVDFNQTHRGSIAFDYRFNRGDGGPILERLGLNMLFTFNSGHPYTRSGGGPAQQGPDEGGILNNTDPRGRTALENIGASTTPWVSNIDLRLDKTITMGPIDANFYVYVQNLLNTKSVLNVYQRTGNAEDDGFLSNPGLSEQIIAGSGPAYVELFQIINLQNRQHWWNNNTGGSAEDLFGTPRQLRFGVSFEY